jgi:hypothetical protein
MFLQDISACLLWYKMSLILISDLQNFWRKLWEKRKTRLVVLQVKCRFAFGINAFICFVNCCVTQNGSLPSLDANLKNSFLDFDIHRDKEKS